MHSFVYNWDKNSCVLQNTYHYKVETLLFELKNITKGEKSIVEYLSRIQNIEDTLKSIGRLNSHDEKL